MNIRRTITVRVEDSLASIDAESWNAMVADTSPFVRYEWLRAMEVTGCVVPDEGWMPQIVSAWEDDVLLGALPMYLKGNSFGEFVYDWSWANLAARLGLSYYPKLIVASPFSPVTGTRILTNPMLDDGARDEVFELLVRASLRVADQESISGLHFLFMPPWQADKMRELGFMIRVAHQYHWKNEGYESFDDFLGKFRSKKRRNIRRERRKVAEAGVEIRTLSGREMRRADLDQLFAFYSNTCERYVWGRQYLNRDFFEEIHQKMPDSIRGFFAHHEGSVIAGTFNMQDEDRLYGRYWGSKVDMPNLHFETCYYAMIDFAIDQGIGAIEPGQGGEHKYDRGFEPETMYSAHWIKNPRLSQVLDVHLKQERHLVIQEVERMQDQSPIRLKEED